MEDTACTEYFTLAVRRYEDGATSVSAGVWSGEDQIEPWAHRLYRDGVDLHEVADDASRLLCGWAALGQWGFIDANDRLRQLDGF